MSEGGWVQIVALLGWLILAGAGLASYRLNWSRAVRMGLVWCGIFIAVALLFSLAMG